MPRSSWKVPFSNIRLERQKKMQKKDHLVWSRASTILPQHLGKQVQVHNGKNWVRLRVSEQMIGHKYGEYALTRKKTTHKQKAVQRVSRKK